MDVRNGCNGSRCEWLQFLDKAEIARSGDNLMFLAYCGQAALRLGFGRWVMRG